MRITKRRETRPDQVGVFQYIQVAEENGKIYYEANSDGFLGDKVFANKARERWHEPA